MQDDNTTAVGSIVATKMTNLGRTIDSRMLQQLELLSW
jgi:hypothetical protein